MSKHPLKGHKVLTDSQRDTLVYLAEMGQASTRRIAQWLYASGVVEPTAQQMSGAARVLNNLRGRDFVGPSPSGTAWEMTEAGAKAIGLARYTRGKPATSSDRTPDGKPGPARLAAMFPLS